jgi:hypothetical protein
MNTDLTSSLPEEAQQLFDELSREPLRPAEELRAEVERYLGTYATARERGGFLDLSQATKLAARIWRLLHAIPRLNEDDRHLVQAAVRYFVMVSDGDEDLGLGGLGDDAAVIVAVEDHIGVGSLAARELA